MNENHLLIPLQLVSYRQRYQNIFIKVQKKKSESNSFERNDFHYSQFYPLEMKREKKMMNSTSAFPDCFYFCLSHRPRARENQEKKTPFSIGPKINKTKNKKTQN